MVDDLLQVFQHQVGEGFILFCLQGVGALEDQFTVEGARRFTEEAAEILAVDLIQDLAFKAEGFKRIFLGGFGEDLFSFQKIPHQVGAQSIIALFGGAIGRGKVIRIGSIENAVLIFNKEIFPFIRLFLKIKKEKPTIAKKVDLPEIPKISEEKTQREIEIDKVYEAKVVKIEDFGCFVELWPGCEGLVHVSQLDHERVNKPSDVVKVGDEIIVKSLGYDNRGRLNLSRKEALPKKEVKEEAKDTKEENK